MMTLLVIVVVVWTVVWILQLEGRLWRLANAAWIGVVAAAQG